MSTLPDIEFFWDPVCPFAWITSRWVVTVARARDLRVDWRFLSLRLLNEERDYSELPPGYEEGHTLGLRLLRVAAAVRAEVGPEPMGDLYTAFGTAIWEQPRRVDDLPSALRRLGADLEVPAVLSSLGLPVGAAAAADDARWDDVLRAETRLTLERTGGDTGTPVLTFGPPDGPSFFGPVLSDVPPDDVALRLWDAVTTLATHRPFAELKRSAREVPRLPALGTA